MVRLISADHCMSQVKEATETQAAFTDSRPALIILDEIDGAMGGTEALLAPTHPNMCLTTTPAW